MAMQDKRRSLIGGATLPFDSGDTMDAPSTGGTGDAETPSKPGDGGNAASAESGADMRPSWANVITARAREDAPDDGDADGRIGVAKPSPAARSGPGPRPPAGRMPRAIDAPKSIFDSFVAATRESFIKFGDMTFAGAHTALMARDRYRVTRTANGWALSERSGPLDGYVERRLRAVGEPDDVAEKRGAYEDAVRTGDAGKMTLAANELLRAVDKAKAELGPEEAARIFPNADGRDPISQILNPQGAAKAHQLYDPNALISGKTRPLDNARAGGKAYRVHDLNALKANGTPKPWEGVDGPLPPHGYRLFDPAHPNDAPEQPAPLTDEQAQAAADAIMRAPEDQGAEMLRQFRERFGDAVAAQVVKHLPPTLTHGMLGAVARNNNARPLGETGGLQTLELYSHPGKAKRLGEEDDASLLLAQSAGRSQNEPRDDLPDKIDYAHTRRNSRPVLVIGCLGAGGGENEAFAALTKELGGQAYITTNDDTARDVVDTINRFQREHPDGIVVVLAYSHGGRNFRDKIARHIHRPVDIAVFFDPYNANQDIELPTGSVRHGFNFYQQNETDSPSYWPPGGSNPFRGSRVKNPEFTNYDLTGQPSVKNPGAKIGHNSIVRDVRAAYWRELDRVLRR